MAVKRATSRALSEAMHNRGLSRRDLADMLGCAPNTIINRLDHDDSASPLTIYELARGIREFGPGFGNAVLVELTGHQLVPTEAVECCPKELAADTSEFLALFVRFLVDNDLSDAELLLLVKPLRPLLPRLMHLDQRAAQIERGRAA